LTGGDGGGRSGEGGDRGGRISRDAFEGDEDTEGVVGGGLGAGGGVCAIGGGHAVLHLDLVIVGDSSYC